MHMQCSVTQRKGSNMISVGTRALQRHPVLLQPSHVTRTDTTAPLTETSRPTSLRRSSLTSSSGAGFLQVWTSMKSIADKKVIFIHLQYVHHISVSVMKTIQAKYFCHTFKVQTNLPLMQATSTCTPTEELLMLIISSPADAVWMRDGRKRWRRATIRWEGLAHIGEDTS